MAWGEDQAGKKKGQQNEGKYQGPESPQDQEAGRMTVQWTAGQPSEKIHWRKIAGCLWNAQAQQPEAGMMQVLVQQG